MNISINIKGITIKLHQSTKKVFFKSLFIGTARRQAYFIVFYMHFI